MKYTNVSDKEYKGFDISIYEIEHGNYIADVKDTNGQLLYGWESLNSFNCDLMKAVAFIDGMVSRGVVA